MVLEQSSLQDEPTLSLALLPKASNTSSSDSDASPVSRRFVSAVSNKGLCGSHPRSLALLSGHLGSVSCVALCGEFVLSASQGRDIIVWQQPDLRRFAKFGQGDGAVKALVAVGNKVFTAHQDSRIRVWKVSRSAENAFRLLAALPTTKDYLGKFMKQSNYVQTRRNHRRLWIEHADSISSLAVCGGLVYSGSWDKTLKVWRISDLKCLESIKAHDDAINALATHRGVLYSASADGRIKAWWRGGGSSSSSSLHCLKGVMEGHKDVSFNSVVLSGDGRWVYGGGSDGWLMGWESDPDASSGSWGLVCDLKAHHTAVLALCSVGEFVFSGSADRTIGMWRRGEGGCLSRIGVIKGHQGPVKCLQAAPDRVGRGLMLYSGSLDRSVRVWWVPTEDFSEKDGSSSFLENKYIMLR